MNKIDKEIAGFLYADGCCMIVRQKKNVKYKDKVYRFTSYIPRVNITQRDDNLPFLQFVKDRYGGTISANNSLKNSNPVFYWHAQKIETVKTITDNMIDTEIPYAKKHAVTVLNEFCKWRMTLPKNKLPKGGLEKAEEFYQAIRKANSYKK